ncbi:flavin reductase family protein [Peribacillus asahii]|uniref:Flavin reductase domain-containing protein FMN-binding protein n=1 Tax=Peribacillus asahii TaxID=228899 RepID=A0A3T0KY43_9BACI|nr:flavin reductase family protein [Peribacillus asahii]AZV45231.1 flavin reductase domain-containing protein FMN-binding protein [Peribacillus asahii]USK69936.1 flavin reductase family protein [Peribacillus asahii]USK84834.1 flavin reductase family protein [Peribacillus asahii]
MDDRQFRTAMGRFATGVTVIATEVEGEAHGMTANAFMSVSLDPKLVVISIGEKAKILNKIKESGIFTVNILAADQQEMSMIFAGQIKDRQVEFGRLDNKPVLPGAIAQVACEVSAEHVEGDHTLFIGKVTDIHLEEKEPLIFFNGKYRSLEEQPAVL